jgi:hypothetical protein
LARRQPQRRQVGRVPGVPHENRVAHNRRRD